MHPFNVKRYVRRRFFSKIVYISSFHQFKVSMCIVSYHFNWSFAVVVHCRKVKALLSLCISSIVIVVKVKWNGVCCKNSNISEEANSEKQKPIGITMLRKPIDSRGKKVRKYTHSTLNRCALLLLLLLWFFFDEGKYMGHNLMKWLSLLVRSVPE